MLCWAFLVFSDSIKIAILKSAHSTLIENEFDPKKENTVNLKSA